MKQVLHKARQTGLARSRDRVRRFLEEWANTVDLGRLARRYPEFHPASFDSPDGRVRLSIPDNWTDELRGAWRETNSKVRDWKLAQLYMLVGKALSSSAMGQGDWAHDLAAPLTEAIRLGDRLAACANPECTAPLFIRKRKNQSACSADCRDAMRRKWRRDWWAEHGRKWRAGRGTAKRRKQKTEGRGE